MPQLFLMSSPFLLGWTESDGNLCIRPTMHRFRLLLINTANELGIENNERLADYQRDTK